MKVLLVEDNRGDARLIREMLRRGGAQFELAHVSRLSQALQRLGEEAFEVVLLDLGLPDSQGVDTFDRIHAQAPDAPVVVLSGTANEALAVEIVQHGAQDYLVKGQVDKNPLVRAIRYAVERKRIEKRLANEERLQDFLDNANDLIQSVGPDGSLIFVNRAWRETLGYTEEEAANLSIFDVVHPDSMEHCMGVFQRVMSGEKVNYVEAEFVAKDGSTVAVEGNVNCRFEDGKPVATRGIFRDITSRRQAEEALRETANKLHAMFDSMRDAVVLTDSRARIVDVNSAALRLHGYSSREEIIGLDSINLAAKKDRVRLIEDSMNAVVEGRTAEKEEYTLLRSDGTEFEAEIGFSQMLDDEGNLTGFLCLSSDITERKRMEEGLRASEEKLRIMFESITDAIVVTDTLGNIVETNEAIARLTGFSKEELLSKNGIELIAPEYQETAAQAIAERQVMESGELSFLAADGSLIHVEFGAAALRDSLGEVTGFISIARDITERKRMEEALKDSEERLRMFIGNAPDAMYVIDLAGNFIDGNRRAEELVGYNKEELIDKNFLEVGILPEEYIPEVLELMERSNRGEMVKPTEIELVRKDGSRVAVETTSFPVESKGKVEVLGIARDITERKRMGEALRASEEKLRFMFESTSDGIAVTDLEGGIVNVNEALTRIAGFNSKQELIGRQGLELLTEEDSSKASEDVAKAKELGQGGTKEYTLPRSDGSVLNVEVSADLLKDGPDNPVGIICIVRDITERKRMEDALKQRNRELVVVSKIAKVLSRPMRMNKMLQAALDSALDVTAISCGGIWLADETGGVLTPATYKGVSSTFKKRSGSIKVGEGVTGQAAETGELVFAPDFLRDVKPNQAKSRMEGLQSIIGVPLKARGKTLGVMTLFERGYRPFSPGDIQLLETIGGEIGVAIENAQLVEKLGELSVTDDLTGLFNRRRFYEVLDAEAARTQRYGHPFSLVIIDLDGFKQYNDTFGHISGDVALEDFANALRLTLRKTDVAFRHGGDEFAVILPSTDACKARKVIQRLRTKWEQMSEVRYKSLKTPIGFSAGIAQLPGDAETADGLLAMADVAMYHAKESGKYRTELTSGL